MFGARFAGRAWNLSGRHHSCCPCCHRHQPQTVGRLTVGGAARGRCLSHHHTGSTAHGHRTDGNSGLSLHVTMATPSNLASHR